MEPEVTSERAERRRARYFAPILATVLSILVFGIINHVTCSPRQGRIRTLALGAPVHVQLGAARLSDEHLRAIDFELEIADPGEYELELVVNMIVEDGELEMSLNREGVMGETVTEVARGTCSAPSCPTSRAVIRRQLEPGIFHIRISAVESTRNRVPCTVSARSTRSR